jgi:hypothetical protein
VPAAAACHRPPIHIADYEETGRAEVGRIGVVRVLAAKPWRVELLGVQRLKEGSSLRVVIVTANQQQQFRRLRCVIAVSDA